MYRNATRIRLRFGGTVQRPFELLGHEVVRRGIGPRQTRRRHFARPKLARDLLPLQRVFACLRKIVPQQRWVGCDSASIRLASSKSATLEELSRQRLRTPRDFVGLNGVSRWVVKPDDGAGAVATRVHTSFDSALADLASRRKPCFRIELSGVLSVCDRQILRHSPSEPVTLSAVS